MKEAFRLSMGSGFARVISMLPKKKRLKLFLKRLGAASPARSGEEALELLARTLNAVENEFSGTPYMPENWKTDGRMYPPQGDSLVRCPEGPSLQKYRSKGHYNYIGRNGSIRIETLDAEILVDKRGADGRRAFDLDN
jgi:hypothetical protein